jgi:hypothetical protein
MIAVSSVGADPLGKNFYLRVKGETEQMLGKLGIPRLDILRPGLLRARARNCARLSGSGCSPARWPICCCTAAYRKYRSIRSDAMAQAIVGLTREAMAGRFVFEHDAILRAARKAGRSCSSSPCRCVDSHPLPGQSAPVADRAGEFR